VTPGAPGRRAAEAGGGLGAETTGRRRGVRRRTLTRPGGEALSWGRDLLAAARSPAADLLAVSLARWGSEQGFRQITAVVALRRVMGSTPPAPGFQAAFCLVLYKLGQGRRGDIATAPPQPCRAEAVSAEQLFYGVRRELPAVSVLVPAPLVGAASAQEGAQDELCQHLHALLASLWTPRWRKAVPTNPRPKVAQAQQSGAQTSMPRLLQAAHPERHTETAAA
jgi:hypothetical protein